MVKSELLINFFFVYITHNIAKDSQALINYALIKSILNGENGQTCSIAPCFALVRLKEISIMKGKLYQEKMLIKLFVSDHSMVDLSTVQPYWKCYLSMTPHIRLSVCLQ